MTRLLYEKRRGYGVRHECPLLPPRRRGGVLTLAAMPVALDATLGASYTFLNAWTLNVEYYRHGSGLSAKEFAARSRFAGDVSRQITANPFANAQLGAALAGNKPTASQLSGYSAQKRQR